MPRRITLSGLEKNIGSVVIMINRKDRCCIPVLQSKPVFGELSHDDDPVSYMGFIEHTGTGRLVVMHRAFEESGLRYILYNFKDGERIQIRYGGSRLETPENRKERTRFIDYVVDLK